MALTFIRLSGESAMIRSSFAPRAATRSYYFAAVLCVIAFAIPVRIASAQGPRIRPGRYKIQNAASDKFMDIDRNDGTIHQWEFGNQKSQLWDIEMGGNGYVYIRSAENAMLLDIAGGAPRDEARLMLAPQNGSQSQLWMIEDAGEGLFRITSRFGKCIDVPDASRANGVGWQLWRPIEKYAEKFRFSLVADAPAGNRDRDPRDRDSDGEARGEKGAYHEGYSFGVQDARAHLRRSYARHKGQYDPDKQDAFIEGYYDGYDSGRADFSQMQSAEKQSYDSGYRFGREDYQERRNPNYTRYAERFDDRTEAYFRRGYEDGFSSPR
jgi:hypothetical protein